MDTDEIYKRYAEPVSKGVQAAEIATQPFVFHKRAESGDSIRPWLMPPVNI
jgi:hypothetical protein